MAFSGFPRGTKYTPVPNSVFGPLLEAIEDLAELKCTLRAFWLLHQKKAGPRFVTEGEILSDKVLLVGLGHLDVPPPDGIRRGMSLGVERGTFLAVAAEVEGKPEVLYFLNDPAGQRAVGMVKKGEVGISGAAIREGAVGGAPEPKPNIFTLYEENIGLVTPLLADQMVDAEASYPWAWIEEAFKLAVGRNKRRWNYIHATLRRWAEEGKDDGESGRHTEKAPSTENLVEYLRRRGRLPEG